LLSNIEPFPPVIPVPVKNSGNNHLFREGFNLSNNKSKTPGTREEMLELQEKGLLWTVRHAYDNCDFYRKKLDEAGISPDDIRRLDDITKLPFTDKAELREVYPFGLMSVPERDIVRIHASSGTTGKKTVAYYTRQDLEDWMDMMARCWQFAGVTPDDRVQITVGYGLWTAGVGFQFGAERLGAMTIPVGPAGNELQMEMLIDLQATAICCTSSYALLLAEEVNKKGLQDKVKLRVGVIGSERWGEKMRSRIEELLNIETFDIIGMTETYGPGTGIDCHVHEGIHYWSDYLIFEIIDPATGKPVAPGEQGEMVVTTLRKEGMPLIRYRTRDITREIPDKCPCGSPFFRIDRILGRTDDMFKFRGVIVYPGQIDQMISETEGLDCEYQIILKRSEGRDSMLLRIECDQCFAGDRSILSQKLLNTIKAKIGISPYVEIVDCQCLPRTERKAKRVFDEREI
jgi:phenylacetate-CoA ligase